MRTQFLAATRQGTGVASAPPVSIASRGSRRFAFIPLGIGGAGLVAGAVCLGLAEGAWQQVTAGGKGSLQFTQAQEISAGGKTLQTVGAAFVIVGLAAAVAGVGLLVFGSPDETRATIALAPNGVLLTGSF